MMNNRTSSSRFRCLIACLTALGMILLITVQAFAQPVIVYAVLFYSPSCAHCEKVIQEDLPPLIEKYGSGLEILGVNVSTTEGQELYRAAVERFNIPEDRLGVPCLIVEDTVLVGSKEIPEQFPAIIEQGISAGGIPAPDIPGLQQAWSVAQASPAENKTSRSETGKLQSTSAVSSAQDNPTLAGSTGFSENIVGSIASDQTNSRVGTNASKFLDNFMQDPKGNTISVIVLIGMVSSLIVVGYRTLRRDEPDFSSIPQWVVPLLALIGISVAGYLSFVELSQAQAVCGPVGDCNLVQQSPYARLFGILPVGFLGLLGYLSLLGLWSMQQLCSIRWQRIASLGFGVIASVGVIISIYLTFLEPFIIGATCLWCITSAVLMTLLLWISIPPAYDAWIEIRREYRGR